MEFPNAARLPAQLTVLHAVGCISKMYFLISASFQKQVHFHSRESNHETHYEVWCDSGLKRMTLIKLEPCGALHHAHSCDAAAECGDISVFSSSSFHLFLFTSSFFSFSFLIFFLNISSLGRCGQQRLGWAEGVAPSRRHPGTCSLPVWPPHSVPLF